MAGRFAHDFQAALDGLPQQAVMLEVGEGLARGVRLGCGGVIPTEVKGDLGVRIDRPHRDHVDGWGVDAENALAHGAAVLHDPSGVGTEFKFSRATDEEGFDVIPRDRLPAPALGAVAMGLVVAQDRLFARAETKGAIAV